MLVILSVSCKFTSLTLPKNIVLLYVGMLSIV